MGDDGKPEPVLLPNGKPAVGLKFNPKADGGATKWERLPDVVDANGFPVYRDKSDPKNMMSGDPNASGPVVLHPKKETEIQRIARERKEKEAKLNPVPGVNPPVANPAQPAKAPGSMGYSFSGGILIDNATGKPIGT